jgi:uncharacterized membrane protein
MTLFVDPYVTDWLNLVLRWLHVVAGIVWIGTSFYFIALDNHLLPPERHEDAGAGVGGETWEIHGGGFYLIQKYRVTPETIPDPLHWFKWEAYWTWISGFALLVVLYYLNADTYLIDRSVADLSAGAAVAISVGLLAASWAIYDVLCRLLWWSDLLLAACILGLVVVASYGTSELFSDRGSYLQVGAMLGTIMSGNVLFNIIPAHRKLIAARERGQEPDPAPGLSAKQRSVHNNYLTLPVVFAMISNHFPFTYGHSHAWLILVAIMAVGAWIRHYFNARHQGRTLWWIPVTGAAALAALGFAIRPSSGPSAPVAAKGRVPFAVVQAIVADRCVPCHSAHPSNSAFTTAPKGVRFDTAEEIAAQAQAIDQQAVISKAMPLGNLTGMTQGERDLLAAWIEQGARTR